MSITKIVSIFCDVNGPNCVGWVAEALSTPQARAVAKKAGWERWGQMDVCPECKGNA